MARRPERRTTADGVKRRLDDDQLDAILRNCGLRERDIAHHQELTDGTYNAAYRIVLANGDAVVLKVAPSPETPVMSYEPGIMRTEALFYRMAERLGDPRVPRVVATGFDGQQIDSDFLLLTACPGRPWHDLRHELDDRTTRLLRHELGRLVARLHSLSGKGFGYPAEPFAPLTASWSAAFAAMVESVLRDADRYRAELPVPAGELRDLVLANTAEIDTVTTPVLTHFDLWNGNILIEPDGPPRIGGIIDAERAFWGDPLADFVSLALFGDIAGDEAFLAGYRDGGGPAAPDDDGARRRLCLYRLYLYLLMLVEEVPRGFSGDRHERVRRITVENLLAAVAELSTS